MTGQPQRPQSPFFSLPNEDGAESDTNQSLCPPQYPPVTLSCASCERIVGDSSAFLCATRQMGTITLDKMVSVDIGAGGLQTSHEGAWDEFCNYKNITCSKCTSALGKMYFATTSKLSSLQNKFTLPLTSLSFYHHSSGEPSLPVAATVEIYQALHPAPEAMAESIDHVMTMCVMLREEQGDIIRELKKLGAATGVEVGLDGGEWEKEQERGEGDDRNTERGGEELKERIAEMEGVAEKVRGLEKAVDRLQRELCDDKSIVQEVDTTKPRKKRVVVDLTPRRKSGNVSQHLNEKEHHIDAKPQQPITKKRKSTPQFQVQIMDTSIDEENSPNKNTNPNREVPNSQSTDDEDKQHPHHNNNNNGNEEEEAEAEDTEEEDLKIKSPATKRRKSELSDKPEDAKKNQQQQQKPGPGREKVKRRETLDVVGGGGRRDEKRKKNSKFSK